MSTYVFNPNKAPRLHGANTVIPPNNYSVLDDKIAQKLSDPIVVEGSPAFQPLWVENIPDRTPDLIP